LAPVTAGERLAPGQHIGFTGAGVAGVVSGADKLLGIVDPFLLAPVFKGDRFFMFLYPNTITSLAHQWTHPAFDGQPMPPDPKEESARWLRDYAEIFGVSYGRLMEGAKEWLDAGEDGEWITLNFDTPNEAYTDGAREFWRHYEVMTGKTAEDTERTFFTCSC